MKILIVDDEKLARLNIIRQLDGQFQIQEASSFEEGLKKLLRDTFDICYIDLKLDHSKNLKGLDLIPESVRRGTYTVVMTSIEDEEIAELAYNCGCQDVYNKGNESEHVSETIGRYFLSRESFEESRFFKDLVPTQNKKYKEDLRKLLKVIHTDIPIILLGESGTGKSNLARIIHDQSKRKGKFVELNCATFKGDTLKSELLGHAKGSFTGASESKTGKLAEAHQGTLFLDEIGSMPQEMQETLLKAIEEKSFYPMGSNRLERSEFRVICATLDDLGILIRGGKFRFDLFQRISGFTFTQPALRERQEDILPLLKSRLSSARKVIFKDEAKRELLSYSWPGNIRELLRFADLMAYSDSGVIRAEDVREFCRGSSPTATSSLLQDHHYEFIKQNGLKEFLEQISREAVALSLKENNGARKAIAELGISSATFYRLQSKTALFSTTRIARESEYELH